MDLRTSNDSGASVAPWLANAPVFESWRKFVDSDQTPFTIPGHKGLGGNLDPSLGRLLASDVPLYGGLDTVKLTGSVLARAERLGADIWGADWCRYSTGGSTHANQALCLALGRPDDTVLVSRTAHRSTLLGLVLAGLRPAWIPSDIDESSGVPLGMSVPALRAALAEHPTAAGVLCVDPSYLGTVSDLDAIIDESHSRDIPVIVDQAWGAHFGFADQFPPHAMAQGADAAIISAHKTLPAFSQASVLLANTRLLDPDRLERAFDAALSTSPSGAILASIDASRALLASEYGVELLDTLVARAATLRRDVGIAGLVCLEPQDFPTGRYDPAKVVIRTSETGHSGLVLEASLLAEGIPVEMADRDTVVPLVSLADSTASISRLADALTRAAGRGPLKPRPQVTAAQWRHEAPQVLTPREAFFAPHRSVPLAASIGHVCTELVAPYPPGIPLLVPGEQITDETLAALQLSLDLGSRIAYAADPELVTIQVVDRS